MFVSYSLSTNLNLIYAEIKSCSKYDYRWYQALNEGDLTFLTYLFSLVRCLVRKIVKLWPRFAAQMVPVCTWYSRKSLDFLVFFSKLTLDFFSFWCQSHNFLNITNILGKLVSRKLKLNEIWWFWFWFKWDVTSKTDVFWPKKDAFL